MALPVISLALVTFLLAAPGWQVGQPANSSQRPTAALAPVNNERTASSNLSFNNTTAGVTSFIGSIKDVAITALIITAVALIAGKAMERRLKRTPPRQTAPSQNPAYPPQPVQPPTYTPNLPPQPPQTSGLTASKSPRVDLLPLAAPALRFSGAGVC